MVAKAPNSKEKAKLVPMDVTSPFEMVSVDFLHLDECKNKFQYIMVVIDHFTRYCQLYATKSKKGTAAADKLFNEFIPHYGCPARVHHDQGGEFTSDMWKELHRFMGIKSSNTTPYHPQGDGQVERCNRTILNMLRSLTANQKKDWKKFLPKLAFAYNSTVNKSTGMSPFYLMYGRESRLPIDTVFPELGGEELPRRNHREFVKEWEKSMMEAVEIARDNIKKSAEYNKKYFDKKAKAVDLEVGDRVLMRNVRERGGTGKLRSYWEEAVFKVVKKREGLPVYEIQNIRKKKDSRVIHRNMLMRCNDLPLSVLDEIADKVRKPKDKLLVRPKQPTSVPDKTVPTPALEPVRATTTPDLEPVVVDRSDSDDDRIAVVVHAEPDGAVPGNIETLENVDEVVESEQGAVPRNLETQETVEADEGVESDHGSDEDEGVDTEMRQVVLSAIEEEESEDLDSDHQSTDQDETSEHEDESDSSDSSDEELPVRPKRTVRPKQVLSYEEGGKPLYKPVSGGKVQKIGGQVTQLVK